MVTHVHTIYLIMIYCAHACNTILEELVSDLVSNNGSSVKCIYNLNQQYIYIDVCYKSILKSLFSCAVAMNL